MQLDTRGFNSKQGTSNFQHNTYKSKICTHCGMTDHKIELFYWKHGFPPYFGKISMVNNDADDNDDTRVQLSTTTSGFSPITQEQFEKLVNLLQNSSHHQALTPTFSNQIALLHSHIIHL